MLPLNSIPQILYVKSLDKRLLIVIPAKKFPPTTECLATIHGSVMDRQQLYHKLEHYLSMVS